MKRNATSIVYSLIDNISILLEFAQKNQPGVKLDVKICPLLSDYIEFIRK
jgi:hypothetical protein